MSLKKSGENPISEKDQLLDRLSILDQNHPDYEAEKKLINEQLQRIAENPQETIDALNLRAETILSSVDKYHADKKHQKMEDSLAVDQLLTEIKGMSNESITAMQSKDAEQVEAALATYFHQLSKTADIVKKAINVFNWRSFKQISKTEKDNLCIQIEKIVINTKTEATRLYRENADTLTISRLINEARHKIQTIADDRHIKIPFEY